CASGRDPGQRSFDRSHEYANDMNSIHRNRLGTARERRVDHGDNVQYTAAKPSPGGHTMIDGPRTATDLDKTAVNKALMQSYMDDLLQGRKEKFSTYFDGVDYIQHNPLVADNLTGLFAGLQALAKQGLTVKYDTVRLV